MKAGIADRRRSGSCGDPSGTMFPPHLRASAPLRVRHARVTLMLGLTALIALRAGVGHAQDASMLDQRVTQQSIGETICRPGYASAVAPPFDELMARKDRMLAERGIDADDAADFALDRRVPVVLGGSPDAPSNLGLLPWAGRQGERRKARAAVMLKRCVCEGKLSLAEAQAAIVGDWSVVYSGFSQESCNISRLDVATSVDGGRKGGPGSSP
ncbi:hypothetical protein [Paraburkholderia phenoliruptrix]|uniref:hypothetical protein n=1 Tax=Paraburkholderia phenoliruptrix TaxID=252970 RepID=UPI001C6DE619|nr:hypothetical protein [Paraburkholderia phenoliruptrix]MBW9102375.1 hypothetical protein [Paraburkholderia phenoliruptrix]MBW9127596.1 hypothetical protein [Paraburkholderia ginsengiterrae]